MKKVRNTLSVAVAIALISSTLLSVPSSAEAELPSRFTNETTATLFKSYNENTFPFAESDLELSAGEITLTKEKSHILSVEVPKDASYNITLNFRPLSAVSQKIEYSLELDEKVPFEEAKMLTANVLWVNDGKITELSNGDQIRPQQKQADGIMSSVAFDTSGIVAQPYLLSLSAGTHTLKITSLGDDFILCGVTLSAPEIISDYKTVIADYSKDDYYKGEQVVIEAEENEWRNDYSLTANGDNSSTLITPRNPLKSLINFVGGASWNSAGQEIAWQLDVPETGLYKLGFVFKQNTATDGTVYRTLKIDGKTPFVEAKEIPFKYKSGWQFNSFKNERDEDLLIYLEKGKHTLSLAVTLADVSEICAELNKISSSIGDLYLDIVMITGETPDANRDYELHRQIPNFEKVLEENSDRLKALSKSLDSKFSVNAELNGAVKNMARIIDNMLANKYQAHTYLNTFYSAYQTLCSWNYDVRNMSLALDKIILAAPDSEFETGKAGFGEKLLFGIRRFASSFVNDYSVESSEGSSDTIKLWVNWGRDQVKILNGLIQNDFSQKHKINVKVEQVNASLVQGVISNNSPDVYLHLARTEPVNLAMRGTLYNLKSFSDYDEVLKNFQADAEMPYLYKDGCYALPDTQGFYCLFYRADILKELNLKIPETWDEFLSATAVIQRKNMNTYLPHIKIVASTTVNTGAGGLTIFPTFLMQNGESLYNNELNATNMASPISVNAFKKWTDFFSEYKLNPDANFYQKFRVGTIPLGVAAYSNYLTFAVAASEIDGKWGITKIPGTLKENGTIDYTCSGFGTGCSIMKSSKNKDAAWEFLKWWVSDDVQYNYSAGVEAVLGQSGRVSTSNVGALKRLSWDKESIDVILDQWKNVKEIEEVPGSYYVSRSIDQAFWQVYNNNGTPKEAISEWARISDEEIVRKIAQYKDKKY